MNNLKGKTAVITGGNSGVGAATALLFAKSGANIVISARRQAALEEVAEKIKAEGGNVLTVPTDISKDEDCKNLMKGAMDAFGRIDILVNNAGITKDGLLAGMSEKDFDRVLDTNLKGAFHTMRFSIHQMLKQRSGRIINLASVVGVAGNAGQANYAASKAGIIGLTKSAAREVASRGITVNAIAPGFIETDMTKVLPEKVKEASIAQIPLGHFGRPEDVAEAAAFLASEAAGYITGQVLHVDGGMVM